MRNHENILTRPPLPPLAKGGRHAPLRGVSFQIRNSPLRNLDRAEIRNLWCLFRPHARASFTLVELLVVITVIGILATITLGVVGGLVSQARDSATKATISKIQALLNSRAQAFQRLSMRQ